MAILVAAQAVPKQSELKLATDSKYVMDTLTRHLKKREDIGWIGIPNAKLLQACSIWLKQRPTKTTFEKVKGHSGITGNEGADSLANEGASQEVPNTLNLTIPPHFKTRGMKLSAATQTLLYKAIIQTKAHVIRATTMTNLEITQYSAEEVTGIRPSRTKVWQSIMLLSSGVDYLTFNNQRDEARNACPLLWSR